MIMLNEPGLKLRLNCRWIHLLSTPAAVAWLEKRCSRESFPRMTEENPILSTYVQLSRDALIIHHHPAKLPCSVPKLPFCCAIRSLGAPVRANSGVFTHRQPSSRHTFLWLRPTLTQHSNIVVRTITQSITATATSITGTVSAPAAASSKSTHSISKQQHHTAAITIDSKQ